MASPASRIALLLCACLLAACTGRPPPPAGRWQGVYEDSRLILLVRMEIDGKGLVHVSAPNAIGAFEGLADEDRAALRARLTREAAETWKSVPVMPLDFDGKDFRKPGGVAPQFEWDAEARRMTMIYYAGNRASVRVPLEQVADFDNS
jgi:hypothetical protein